MAATTPRSESALEWMQSRVVFMRLSRATYRSSALEYQTALCLAMLKSSLIFVIYAFLLQRAMQGCFCFPFRVFLILDLYRLRNRLEKKPRYPRERSTRCVSLTLVNYCTAGRIIAFEKACNNRMTSNVTQGHHKWRYSSAQTIQYGQNVFKKFITWPWQCQFVVSTLLWHTYNVLNLNTLPSPIPKVWKKTQNARGDCGR